MNKFFHASRIPFLSFILGIISNLAFAPIFLYQILFFIIPILMDIIIKSSSFKRAFYLSYIFGFGHFFAGLYWISFPLTLAPEFTWLIPFALLIPPILLGFFIAVPLSLTYKIPGKFIKIISFPVIFILFEYIRSFIFTGFPWNLIGYALADNLAFAQIAYYIGIYGLGFILLITASSFYLLLIHKNFSSYIWIFLIIINWQVITYFGNQRLENNKTEFTNIYLRIVQPCIKADLQFEFQKFYRDLQEHIILSKAPSQEKIDLIIWSEASLPVIPYDYLDHSVKEIIKSIIPEEGYLFTSSIEEKNSGELKIYTSLIGIEASGKKIFSYPKYHLLPFGEYIPFRSFINIDKITAGTIDFTPGELGLYINKFKQIPAFKPLICYEAIFPGEAKQALKSYKVDFKEIESKDFEWLLNITNDVWFGNSIGPYQHFYMHRMRAIEQGKPLIRTANNGISAIIDSYGRIIKRLNLNEKNILDGYLPKAINGRSGGT